MRRRPEATALYQTVAEHWPAFRERMEEAGGLPKFVVGEFEEFLKCGIVEEGCLHLVCRSCGYSEVVALSCKKRGFCSSCLGRRMCQTALNLVEQVLPQVPLRQWVLTLPFAGHRRHRPRPALAALPFGGDRAATSLSHRALRGRLDVRLEVAAARRAHACPGHDERRCRVPKQA